MHMYTCILHLYTCIYSYSFRYSTLSQIYPSVPHVRAEVLNFIKLFFIIHASIPLHISH